MCVYVCGGLVASDGVRWGLVGSGGVGGQWGRRVFVSELELLK